MQVLLYLFPGSDFASKSYTEYSEGFFLQRSEMEWFLKQYLRDEKDILNPLFSPFLNSELSNLPSATIVTAECDPSRDQAESYAFSLSRAGVDVTCVRFNKMIYGFISFPINQAEDTIEMLGAAIERRLCS